MVINQQLIIPLYKTCGGFSGATVAEVLALAGSISVEDDGVPIVAAPTALNFIGAGVAVVDNAGVADITIAGDATSLGGLSDVTLTAPTTNNTFFFDGTNWINNDRIFFTAGTTPQILFFDGTAGQGVIQLDAPNELSIKSGSSTVNFKATPTEAQIFGAGSLRLKVNSSNLEQVTVVAVGVGDALLRFEDGGGEFGHLIKENAGEFILRNQEAGANLRFMVRNTIDSADETGILIEADGGVTLLNNNADALGTNSTGAFIRPGGGGDNSVRVVWENADETLRATVGYLSADVFSIRSQLTSEELRIQTADSGDTIRNNIRMGGAFAAAALAFYGTAPIVLQTGVAVTSAGIHAALVNLGLITA